MSALFFSYSHVDETLRDELEVHLSMLKRQGVIEAWHDRRIVPGESIDAAIDTHLEKAEIILLLVSPNFIASDYCYEREMQCALERNASGAACVIPVILRPCDWHTAPFGGLRAVPQDGRPITMWPNQDAAFLDVTKAVREVAERFKKVESASPLAPSIHSEVRGVDQLRSSNLRIAKVFSDRDRDDFLSDSFEYIEKYLRNSLLALQERNPSIETRFRKIDAHSFVAKIYQNGQERAACTIFYGPSGFGGNSICYVQGESLGKNSMNDWVSVEADDQKLFLKPSGLLYHAGSGERKLSPEGASEHFWSQLMGPLQGRR